MRPATIAGRLACRCFATTITKTIVSRMLIALALALLTGRLVTVDRRPLAGARVVVHWTRGATLEVADTLTVSPDGSFGALAREVASDSVTIDVLAAPDSRYFANRVTLPVARLAS